MSSHNPHKEAQEENAVGKISPRGLRITWGNDSRYWRINSSGTEAELLQVCWLEVTGKVRVDPRKKYNVKFEVSMRPDAFGWNGSPLLLMAKMGASGKYVWSRVNLQEQQKGVNERFQIPKDGLVVPPLPDNAASGITDLIFGMYEVSTEKWKGGLRIHHAFVQEEAKK
ncbi:protein PHLOEM PROTEIN 2-LIKE A9-like [Malania oleifera]|uniref:protein PHLOEM PROTEIN 2-LIKE A9-like n=1 Tax=Malania oleifera TaxID=397392 RepID=UPI0025ADEE7B|nr:protein PHLOEM PROTEIN 2-LIKE A9-like [Malania oleifera]